MRAQVAERRAKIREQPSGSDDGSDDIFSLLMKANETEEKEKLQLNDAELVGNKFICHVLSSDSS
jgi:hypothetical protein